MCRYFPRNITTFEQGTCFEVSFHGMTSNIGTRKKCRMLIRNGNLSMHFATFKFFITQDPVVKLRVGKCRIQLFELVVLKRTTTIFRRPPTIS